jgi:hypothetical protein
MGIYPSASENLTGKQTGGESAWPVQCNRSDPEYYPQVTSFDSMTLASLVSFFTYNPQLGNGVFVGGCHHRSRGDPRNGGRLTANVNRWRAQLGLEALSEDDAAKSVRTIKVDGLLAHSVDLTGPMVADKLTQRIQAVIVERGEQTWYFKLMGPASLVEEQGRAFDGFIKSIRFEK